ncbi:isochorismate synthase [Nocardia miyunensis]|uniref:isochorismate synthase n=1 Tax=Nocardia miyunensis TaxID=282684 RepID=UPI00082AF186|nr:isochorismate synthase [Nocardia miyunensis]
MDGFLLAQPGGVVRTDGVRRAFDDADSAAAELAGGAELIVGALPFDPRTPAALCVPERARHTAGPWRPAAVPPLPEVRVISEIPSPAAHIARVAKLVEQLSDPSQPLRKVVAARSVLVRADEPLDPEVVAAHLLSRHPRANVFAVDLSPAGRPGATLVGATPEVLVARHGETVTLRPLAGTIARHPDPAVDAERSRELLASTKNREEHAFVIEWIREQLAPLCGLTVPDAPELINTHEVWHLATPISGRVRDASTTAFDLARALHPTPAVCGTPTGQALDAIIESEEDRGFYGGAVGWCDARGDGEWVVAIRCAELSADGLTVRAFGGGGIVAASDPRAELDETTAKLRTFLGSLNCPVDGRTPDRVE